MTNRDGRSPAVYELSEMSGYEFEETIRTLLDRLGYEADVTRETSDLGRDVIAETADETLIVECKNHSSAVGRPVVQKLHSATVSYDRESRGLVVCPGGFTEPAREHARELGATVRLWGFSDLVERGRSVDLYFLDEEAGTHLVFECDVRPAEKLEARFERDFLANLVSRPRDIDRAVGEPRVRTSRMPAIRVEYDLDETFGSSTYPELFRARDRGVEICPLDSGGSRSGEISNAERLFWAKQSFDRRCDDMVDGQPPAAYFGIDPSRYEDQVSREVAQRNSTTEIYYGDNNQRYTKECRVDPDDVSTESLQVFLVYQVVAFELGPRSSEMTMTAAGDAPPKYVGARSIDTDEAHEVWGGRKGLVCNECAAIQTHASVESPAVCKGCSRTLCSRHHWDFPSPFAWSSTPYCSRCYQGVRREHPGLESSSLNSNWKATFAAIAPLPALAVEGRYAAALAVGALATASLVTPLVLGRGLPIGLVVFVCTWLAATCWLLLRTFRVRRHLANLEELDGYRPAWTDGEQGAAGSGE